MLHKTEHHNSKSSKLRQQIYSLTIMKILLCGTDSCCPHWMYYECSQLIIKNNNYAWLLDIRDLIDYLSYTIDPVMISTITDTDAIYCTISLTFVLVLIDLPWEILFHQGL